MAQRNGEARVRLSRSDLGAFCLNRSVKLHNYSQSLLRTIIIISIIIIKAILIQEFQAGALQDAVSIQEQSRSSLCALKKPPGKRSPLISSFALQFVIQLAASKKLRTINVVRDR